MSILKKLSECDCKCHSVGLCSLLACCESPYVKKKPLTKKVLQEIVFDEDVDYTGEGV